MSDTESKMSDTENADNFAEEIVETGVIRKTVRKSYIIQEVSINVVFMQFAIAIAMKLWIVTSL